jgi:tRNA1(Val) A37 N6-methylase TrmN6
MENKKVLDVCCGPKGMWFDKQDERALYLDKRNKDYKIEPNAAYPNGTTIKIRPDIVGDFTDIKQPDNSFWHIVFDPPHIPQDKITAVITKQYGNLTGEWRGMLKKGFEECFRVLKPNGTLIFKWNECRIPLKEILKLTDKKPLYGHKSGKAMKTHWVAFIKN